MGLGKTVMALALIAESIKLEPKQKDKCGTLIVVPKSVISQWSQEIQLHFKPDQRLKVYSYYTLKDRKSKVVLSDYDIILTTYAVVGMDYADKFGSVKEQSEAMQEK